MLIETDLEQAISPEDMADAIAADDAATTDTQTDPQNTEEEQLPPGDLVELSSDIELSQTDTDEPLLSAEGVDHESETPDEPKTETKPARKRSSAVKTGSSRRRSAKKSEDDSGSDASILIQPESGPDEPDASESDDESPKANTPVGQQPRAPRRRARRSDPIVSIDEERTVQTTEDKLQSDLLDLVESLKTRKILTGTIQGVERSTDNPNISFAVIYHGEFKVIIPAEETVEPPADFRDRLPGDVMHYLITKRLGAEVDFIVKGVDQETGIAAASRLDAMAAKRREYYFGSDRDGNNLLYEGIAAEARVVSVIRAGIFVDLFGVECYIPLRELSYQRWVDAASHYQAGQRVLVKVLSIERSGRSNVKVTASVKQAGENPYDKALRKYSVGSRYVGTVSMVDTNGVFVSLDGGIDCLCSYPKRGRPPRGSRVTVRILGINHDSNRIWGAITHMTNR